MFALSLAVQWGAAYLGDLLRRKVRPVARQGQADFDIVLSATLTLLALIIGFSFSMAVSRYDQRKNLEAQEANAIGTEYVRTDLLPAQDQTKVRDLLRHYVDQRIQYYRGVETTAASSDSLKLQAQLWSSVVPVGIAQPTPVVALVISGMNDVLNSQGYSQAAQLNRIPTAAWALLRIDRDFCQYAARLSRTAHRFACSSGLATDRIDRAISDLRYRHPARRRHPRGSE